MNKFRKELIKLISIYGIDEDMKTPDYILAAYLVRCLKSYEMAVYERDIFNNNGEPIEKAFLKK